MTAFLYLTSMKIILTVCSLLLVVSAGAQTDVTLFDRHIDAQGAHIVEEFVTTRINVIGIDQNAPNAFL